MSNPSAVTWPKITSAAQPDPTVEVRIDELLSRMTLEEKVGQMIQPEIRHVTPQDVKDYHLGSVLNGGGSVPHGNRYCKAAGWDAMAYYYYAASMYTIYGGVVIPMLCGRDAVHSAGYLVV